MKKTLIVAAALSAIAGTAAAQSSVTLFGVVDINGQYVRNSSSTKDKAELRRMSAGGLNGSRLGFRGVEDLGSGLKAAFHLESGFNADDGSSSAATQFFNRRSTLGLMGGFGEVRIGRDFSTTYNLISKFDAFDGSGFGQFANLQAKLGATVETLGRSSNQVSYFLPKDIGGVYGQVAAAPGEKAAGSRYAGFLVGYAADGLDVAGGFSTTRDQVGATPGVGNNLNVATLGASYDLKMVKVMAAFTQYKLDKRKAGLIMLGVTAPVSSSGLVKVSVANLDQSTSVSSTDPFNKLDAMQAALGYEHNLSKRTALYSTLSYIKNKATTTTTGRTTTTTGAAFSVAGTSLAVAPGGKSAGLEVGVRHRF